MLPRLQGYKEHREEILQAITDKLNLYDTIRTCKHRTVTGHGSKLSMRKDKKKGGFVYGESRTHLLKTLGDDGQEELLPQIDPKLVKRFTQKTSMSKGLKLTKGSIHSSFDLNNLSTFVKSSTDPIDGTSYALSRHADSSARHYPEILSFNRSKDTSRSPRERYTLKKPSQRKLTLKEYEIIQMNQHSQNIIQEKLRRRRMKSMRSGDRGSIAESLMSRVDSKKDMLSFMMNSGKPGISLDSKARDHDNYDTRSLSKPVWGHKETHSIPGLHVHSYSIDHRVLESMATEINELHNLSTDIKSNVEYESHLKQTRFDEKPAQRSARDRPRKDVRLPNDPYAALSNLKRIGKFEPGPKQNYNSDHVLTQPQNNSDLVTGSGSLRRPGLQDKVTRRLTDNRLNSKSLESGLLLQSEEPEFGKILPHKIYSLCTSNNLVDVKQNLLKNLYQQRNERAPNTFMKNYSVSKKANHNPNLLFEQLP